MITLDHESATPPFEQIREQIGAQIRLGSLKAGQRLPSIRQLASDLHVAPGTVARAIAELEEDGLVVTSRAGTVVSNGKATAEPLSMPAQRLVTAARTAGLSLDEAIAALRGSWASGPRTV